MNRYSLLFHVFGPMQHDKRGNWVKYTEIENVLEEIKSKNKELLDVYDFVQETEERKNKEINDLYDELESVLTTLKKTENHNASLYRNSLMSLYAIFVLCFYILIDALGK